MVNRRKRRVVQPKSNNAEEAHGVPGDSHRKRPIDRDDSDSRIDDAMLVKLPGKRKRRFTSQHEDDEISTYKGSRRSGTNDEDHVLLISSLQASQTVAQSSSALPDLPGEILLTILEMVEPCDLLDHRLVCKSFRDAVDTHVFYHHIQDAELIGYLGSKKNWLLEHLNSKDYWDFAFVKTRFDCLDDQEEGQAKWDPPGASFRISSAWADALIRVGGYFHPGNAWWDHMTATLDLQEAPFVYGQLRWCIKIGPAVLDFGIADKNEVNIELIEIAAFDKNDPVTCLTIRVTDWKVMLMNFFREERALKLLMQETLDADYTYSHMEDSLRDMRRKRYRSKLNPDDQNDSRTLWKMSIMRPLWGRVSNGSATASWDDVERVENFAVETLLLLRRDAAMSHYERAELDMLVVEKATMNKEIKLLDSMFKKWQEQLLALPNLSLERIHLDQELYPNPLTWSDEVVDRLKQSLTRWKGQKEVIKQMTAFLDATNTVAMLAEDAFETDSGSEF